MFLLIIHIKKESESEKGGWEAHLGETSIRTRSRWLLPAGSGPPRRRWEGQCVGCSNKDGFQAGELGKTQVIASHRPGTSEGIVDIRMPALVTGAARILARGPLGWSSSVSPSSSFACEEKSWPGDNNSILQMRKLKT